MIDIRKLPKEVQDVIELREATDQTFSRFCVSADELVFADGRLVTMGDVRKGMVLVGRDGLEREVLDRWDSKKECVRVVTDSVGDVVVSTDHRMVLVDGTVKKSKDLCVGDVLLRWRFDGVYSSKQYEDGFCASVSLAGNKGDCVSLDDLKNVVFAKGFVDGLSQFSVEGFEYTVQSKYLMCCLLVAMQSLGRDTTVKKVSENVYRVNCNSVAEDGVRDCIVKDIIPEGERDCVDVEVSDDHMFALGNGVVVHNCDEDYTEIFWNTLAQRAQPDVEHSMLASVTGTQGSGKSLSAIAMCSYMDPTFNIDRIYFDYNQLVYDRGSLKPNTAVLVDEQSQSYGLDSHRVMIILASLKEQLRKKSIHFFFCSPVLYEESKSSMYQIETIFIDYETKECYAALKTREGLTLGHIRIPHPLKQLSDGTTMAPEYLVKAYEQKKDRHLETVLGKDKQDVFQDRAVAVMQHELFKKAEKQYVKAMGYMPQSTVVNIINKIFPEYHAGVVPMEIAGRIKLEKELSGEWEISGRSGRSSGKKVSKKTKKAK